MKIEQDDDGTQSASNDVNPTEVEDGQYRFDLTQAETNGDKLTFYPESSTAGVQVIALPSCVIYTRPPGFSDFASLASFFTSSAQLVDDIWDEVITGAQHNVQNSSARFLREGSESNALLRGTAQSGTVSTIVLESGAITADDLLNGERVAIIEGTGVGQSRLISDSVASSDTVTVAHNWTTAPDNTSVYAVMGAEVDVRAVAEQSATATATVDFDDLASTLTDTNELQTDWADGGRLDVILDSAAAGSGGTGAWTINYTVKDEDSVAISQCDVICTTSSTSSSTGVVASAITNASGTVTFLLDAGTYYLWRQKDGTNFTNPKTLTVAADGSASIS